jgi:putative ABC transport system ATP-binding protein
MNVGIMPPARIPQLRRSMGVVFQDYKLLSTRTVLENVAFVLKFLGVPTAERKRRAYQTLRLVELHHRLSALPEELSGGEQQRVAIARALTNQPQLILADEPTGNLDTQTSIEIMNLFTELNRATGVTILLVTHENDIARYANRLIRFKDGRVVHDGAVIHDDAMTRELAAR